MSPYGLRVHRGVLYERNKGDAFWWPATDYSLRNYHKGADVSDVKVDPNAWLLCDCGSTAFSVKSPSGEYETSIRCRSCGAEAVIHDG